MKILSKTLQLLFLVIVFTSCSKPDVEIKEVIVPQAVSLNSLLLGKWEYEKTGTIQNGVETLIDWTHYCATKKDYAQFLTNNVYYLQIYNVSCTDELVTKPFYIKQTFSENLIVINDVPAFKIITLTAKELKYSFVGSNQVAQLKKIN